MPSNVVSLASDGEGNTDVVGFKGNNHTKNIGKNSLGKELDIKVVCVGAANTGKTTFLRYWESGECPMHLSTTIQMEFHRREMTIAVPSYAYYEKQYHLEEASACTTTTTSNNNNNNNSSNSIVADSEEISEGNVSFTADPMKNSVTSHSNTDHSKSGNQESKVRSQDSPEITTRLSTFPPPSIAGGSNNWNSVTSSSNCYSALQNPYGDEYRILPPRMPLFYAQTTNQVKHNCSSGNCSSSGKDTEQVEWSLTHVPAIVKVWDIQGQESTKRMTRIFYTGAIAVLIFSEMGSSTDSLANALSWKSDVEQKIFIPKTKWSKDTSKGPVNEKQKQPEKGVSEEREEYENPPCWLVVNKYDLLPVFPSPPEWASHMALNDWCARHGFAGWTYTVGRKGVNVEAVMQALIAEAVQRFPQQFRVARNRDHNDNDGDGNGDDMATVPRTRNRYQKRREGGCCRK